jgi:hypothetical protein
MDGLLMAGRRIFIFRDILNLLSRTSNVESRGGLGCDGRAAVSSSRVEGKRNGREQRLRDGGEVIHAGGRRNKGISAGASGRV